MKEAICFLPAPGADLGGGYRGCALPEMTCGFLIQLVFCNKKETMWFIGVELEQGTSAPPPKKNPGSAPGRCHSLCEWSHSCCDVGNCQYQYDICFFSALGF